MRGKINGFSGCFVQNVFEKHSRGDGQHLPVFETPIQRSHLAPNRFCILPPPEVLHIALKNRQWAYGPLKSQPWLIGIVFTGVPYDLHRDEADKSITEAAGDLE